MIFFKQNVFYRNRFPLSVSKNYPFDSKPEELVWSQNGKFVKLFVHASLRHIIRNEYRKLQLLFKLGNGDVRL